MTVRIGALVVAGGRGRRIGQPKATLRVGGETLVERAVGIARAAGCTPIRVLTAAGIELPPLDGVDVLVDREPGGGALAAIADGLSTFPAATDVVVLACDLPNCAPLVARLCALPAGGVAVAADRDGRDQPLCARYPAGAAAAVARDAVAAGDRRMRALVEALAPVRVEARGDELLNINAPSDLDTLT